MALRTSQSRGPRGAASKRGAMLPIFAMAFAMLLTFAGLTLDGGNIYYERQRAQAAADAGAYAGALELKRGTSTWVTPSAKEDAKLNGFDDNDADVTVTVNNPPVSGPSTGDANFVEVIVQSTVPTTLLRLVGPTISTVRARAVAGIAPDWGGPCILSLNTSESGAITVSGTAEPERTELRCRHPLAGQRRHHRQRRRLHRRPDDRLRYGRRVRPEDMTANGQNCLSPEPIGAIPSEDPYASMTAPASADLTLQSSTRTTITGNASDPPTVLQPGYYQNGIKITGGNVELSPGVYLVDGFDASGNAAITGEGVTIINTGNGGLRNISIAGTVQVELSATNDTSSPYNNILFYDANPTNCGNPCDATLNGTSDSTYEGIMYFPNVHLDYAGTEDQSAFSQIIADTIRLTGTALVEQDWDAGDGRVPSATRVSFSE